VTDLISSFVYMLSYRISELVYLNQSYHKCLLASLRINAETTKMSISAKWEDFRLELNSTSGMLVLQHTYIQLLKNHGVVFKVKNCKQLPSIH